jgi:chromosome partitioning protein
MTDIICAVGKKGGVGKTTIITNLAVQSALDGDSVLIIDCDGETEVAESWFNMRNIESTSNNIFLVPVRTFSTLNEVVEKAKQTKIDKVFIDTPGTDSNLVSECIKLSTLIILPCGAGGFDLLTLTKSVNSINRLDKNSEAAFVITKQNAKSNEALDTRKLLNGFGINICPHHTTNLKAYRDAAVSSMSVEEFDSESKAAFEMRKIYKWMLSRLTKNPIQKSLKEITNGEK